MSEEKQAPIMLKMVPVLPTLKDLPVCIWLKVTKQFLTCEDVFRFTHAIDERIGIKRIQTNELAVFKILKRVDRIKQHHSKICQLAYRVRLINNKLNKLHTSLLNYVYFGSNESFADQTDVFSDYLFVLLGIADLCLLGWKGEILSAFARRHVVCDDEICFDVVGTFEATHSSLNKTNKLTVVSVLGLQHTKQKDKQSITQNLFPKIFVSSVICVHCRLFILHHRILHKTEHCATKC